MILRVEDIKDLCNKILFAVDSNEMSQITETLELKVENRTLYMSVTNREYYTQVKLALDEDVNLHATVMANLFLKLINQTTTDTVEFNVVGNSLVIRGNGTYKLPLIYDGDVLLELPTINVENITAEFDVSSSILQSILTYNSKELTKGDAKKQVQKMYYIDETGAITFTTGACVNNFTLPTPVKLLLNPNVVKLFKLFNDELVHFTLGHTAISDEIIQTRVRFETATTSITAILLCDDNFLNQVPVTQIRNRITTSYPYSVVLNKNDLLQAINRLTLFAPNTASYVKLTFKQDSLSISDSLGDNNESLYYENNPAPFEYTAKVVLNSLKTTLDTCYEQDITLNFGDGNAFVFSRGTIYNVIPEAEH